MNVSVSIVKLRVLDQLLQCYAYGENVTHLACAGVTSVDFKILQCHLSILRNDNVSVVRNSISRSVEHIQPAFDVTAGNCQRCVIALIRSSVLSPPLCKRPKLSATSDQECVNRQRGKILRHKLRASVRQIDSSPPRLPRATMPAAPFEESDVISIESNSHRFIDPSS